MSNRRKSARSLAASKGWETRRANQREAEKRARKRSKASKKGWVARREKSYLADGMHPRSARDWAMLSAKQAEELDVITNIQLPALYYAAVRGVERARYMRQFVEDDRERFETMVRTIERNTEFSASQIRTAFFSPKALKV